MATKAGFTQGSQKGWAHPQRTQQPKVNHQRDKHSGQRRIVHLSGDRNGPLTNSRGGRGACKHTLLTAKVSERTSSFPLYKFKMEDAQVARSKLKQHVSFLVSVSEFSCFVIALIFLATVL